MSVLALLAAMAQPRRPAKSAWIVAVLICGTAAVGLSAWQQAQNRAVLDGETAQLHSLWERLDELGRSLPAGSAETPAETLDAAAAAIRLLSARVADLGRQLRDVEEKSRTRQIDPETAANVARHLRQFGRHRVVVSCVPDDVEAFAYATQFANMLREAGWEALGPERTTIFGEGPAMAVKLFVRDGAAPPQAVTLLIDAFSRFNIPFQSGIAPTEAIPDAETVELFVSRKS